MLARPGLASTLPTGLVVRPAIATVVTVAGLSSENASRGPSRRTRASFGGAVAAAGEPAPGAAAPAAAGVVPAAPPAPRAGAGRAVGGATTLPRIPPWPTHKEWD